MAILDIVKSATTVQLNTACIWATNQLHVPIDQVTDHVAVAYVERHYKAGRLEGWDGFITDIAEPPAETVDVMKLAAQISLSYAAAEITHVEGPHETGSGATNAVLWLKHGPYGVSLSQGGANAYDGPRGFQLGVVRKTGEWTEETGIPRKVDVSNPVVPHGIERNPDFKRVVEIIWELAKLGS